jgi:hypothetical protein
LRISFSIFFHSYAASFTRCTDGDCLTLFGGENCEATTWAGFVQSLFPDAPERLARRFLDKFRTGRLHLVIACDDAPRGLRELVRGVVGQHALGEYDFRVVEIAPYVAEASSSEVIFLPHVVLETEIVARSSVTVSLAEGGRQPSVNVSVTPFDDVQERSTEKQLGKLWTADELAEAYRTLPDQRLSQRLLRLLRWAVERNCLITGKTANPVFGLRGVTGKRIISFSPGWKPFSYPAPDNYASTEAREAFVRDLHSLGLYDPNRAVTSSPNGQSTERDLIVTVQGCGRKIET